MKARKTTPKTNSKSAKASSRVTAAAREISAASGVGGRRSQRQAMSATSEKAGRRRVQTTRGQAIQGHISARGRRQQARRDSR